MDVFGLPAGVVVVLVVLMALFMFWGAEQLERIFGKRELQREPKWRLAAGSGLVAVALVTALVGQPTTAERIARMAPEMEQALAERRVQIEPAELLSLMHNDRLNLIMIDVRSETDYNLFHLLDAEHVELSRIPEALEMLRETPDNTVVVVMSNQERASSEAWRILTAESVPNAYILGGGLNGWIQTFGDTAFLENHPSRAAADEELGYRFTAALGDRYPVAFPDPEEFELEYEPKVTLSTRRGPSGGGCGG
jgi:rhodanese-related sulfurtransferase